MEAEDRMNCIPRLKIHLTVLCMAWFTACGAPASEPLLPSDPLTYRIDYSIRPEPANGTVDVTLDLTQGSALLREMTIRADSRMTNFRADGMLDIGNETVRWTPPVGGGTLSWRVTVAHLRNDSGPCRLSYC